MHCDLTHTCHTLLLITSPPEAISSSCMAKQPPTHPICLMASLVQSVEAFDKELAGAENEIAELQLACVLIEKLPPYVGSADIQLPEKADWGFGLAAVREAMSGATMRLSNKVNRKGLAWIKTLCENGTAELEGGVSGQVAKKIPNATGYMKNSAATFDLCSGQQLEKAVLGSSWAEFADALPQYVKGCLCGQKHSRVNFPREEGVLWRLHHTSGPTDEGADGLLQWDWRLTRPIASRYRCLVLHFLWSIFHFLKVKEILHFEPLWFEICLGFYCGDHHPLSRTFCLRLERPKQQQQFKLTTTVDCWLWAKDEK